ncbi:MAG: PAS domain S-box protein [Proteobacteria bacterium]|nr:PAS domain S-box protein [Pseudomonadota bacterium]
MSQSKYSILETIINTIPQYIFWKDRNLIFMGCNKLFAEQFGYENPEELIGKTDDEFDWSDELRKKYRKDDLEVIEKGLPKINFVEKQKQLDGSFRTVSVSKTPIFSDHGEIIGVLGIYTDITELKEAEEKAKEALELKSRLEQQAKFVHIANQVAHDIRSPLSSLLMIVKNCTEVPEEYRIAMREAAISIGDIANNLLAQYREPDGSLVKQEETKAQDVLVSSVLLELLTEKKYQYQNFLVQFDYDFPSNSYFAFIKVQLNAFRRMISNIINNAVDAFDGKLGKVILRLECSNEFLKIIVEDNGKGMPKEVVEKILKNIAVTSGKKEGNGIGLMQVQETLKNYQGEMNIDSKENEGTKIILIFPRMNAPVWIADKISLRDNDIVVILDDEKSIHGAWNMRFESILKSYSNIELKNFWFAKEALEFMESISLIDRPRIFLLTDFELLKEKITGLDVVLQANIKRAVLVTSHYANKQVLADAAKTDTKILPKQLASEISIEVISSPLNEKSQLANKADVVLVDDDALLTNMLTQFVFSEKQVAVYHDPEHFLSEAAQYAKDTSIYLDCNFEGSKILGTELARQLHERGYTCLYLLTGQAFEMGSLPSYLTVLRKDDIDSIAKTKKK